MISAVLKIKSPLLEDWRSLPLTRLDLQRMHRKFA